MSQMLTGHLLKRDGERYKLADIVAWARLKGVPVSKAALSRHFSTHLRPTAAPAEEPHHPPTGTRVSRHLKRAAEALVLGVFEQVRAEFADALEEAVRGTRRPPAPLEDLYHGEHLDADTLEESITPEQRPVKPSTRPRKAAPRGDRQRSMPRDFQSALKLEAALNRIQAMPRGMRPTLLEELAAEHGKHSRTAWRWMRAYELHGLAGIMRAQRSDKGAGRIPASNIKALLGIIEGHPHLSGRKLYALLKTSHVEALEYTGRNGQERLVSSATVNMLIRQVREPAGTEE